MATTPQRIRVAREGSTVLVGVDRPEKRNALDQQMVDEFTAVLDQSAQRPCVVIVHSTTPGMFVAGADIAELRERGAVEARQGINALLFDRLARHPWPTIAVVDGPALGGGCELALACDFRVASPRASFAQPELSLGILAGAGANWRLPQLVGIGLARRMLFLGERIDAQAALQAGLVDAVDDDPMRLAHEYAARIGSLSWRALELTKTALASGVTPTTAFDIEAQAELFASDDKMRRMTAFLERRGRAAP